MPHIFSQQKRGLKKAVFFLTSAVLFSLVFSMLPWNVPAVYAGLPGTTATIDPAHETGGELSGFIVDQTIGRVFSSIGGSFQGIGSWILAKSGDLFDTVLVYTLDSSHYSIPTIYAGWETIRDVANMTFIFILVYLAILTILQAGGFNTKKVLLTLIIIALLLNFSFFLTGIVIDAANIIALIFHNALTTCPASNPCAGEFQNYKPLSLTMIEALDPANVLGDGQLEKLSHMEQGGIKSMAGLVYIVAAFIFISSAILFALRTIVLMLVLVFSPLAFAAAVLPTTGKYFNIWLDKLIGNAFVAPMYLLILIIIVRISQSTDIYAAVGYNAQTSSAAQAVNILNGNSSSLGWFMAYIIFIGLFQAALIISRNMANEIAGLSVKWAGKVTGAGIGAAAFLGRRSIGFGADRFSQGRNLQEAAKDPGLRGSLARGMISSSQWMSKRSFDLRAGKTGTVLKQGLAAGTGQSVDVGRAGGRGGYAAIKNEQVKRAVEGARAFKTEEGRKQYAAGLESGIFAKLAMRRDVRQEAANKILDPIREKELQATKKRSDLEIQAQKTLIAKKNEDAKKFGTAGISPDDPENIKLKGLEDNAAKIEKDLNDIKERLGKEQKAAGDKSMQETMKRAAKEALDESK